VNTKELLEFLTSSLDLTDKFIQYAALGMGKAASYWAEMINESRDSSRIIAIDKTFLPITVGLWRKL